MFYYIQNSGFDKELTFLDKKDCSRFISTLDYYKAKDPPSRFSFRNRPGVRKKGFPQNAVEIVCFCLMPRGFYLLIRQVEKGDVASFISRIKNSYTRYFNAKYKKRGMIFQESFKAVRIENDKQLLSVSRYIHLRPAVESVVRHLKKFPFSSYLEYLGIKSGFCQKDTILDHFKNPQDYEKFVLDQEDYGRSIKKMERQVLEEIENQVSA